MFASQLQSLSQGTAASVWGQPFRQSSWIIIMAWPQASILTSAQYIPWQFKGRPVIPALSVSLPGQAMADNPLSPARNASSSLVVIVSGIFSFDDRSVFNSKQANAILLWDAGLVLMTGYSMATP
jgi:hypothetical protein